MSMYLNFEPHSWYMGFAIKHNPQSEYLIDYPWEAYTDDGNTYQIVTRHANTLKQLKLQIKYYRTKETARISALYKETK